MISMYNLWYDWYNKVKKKNAEINEINIYEYSFINIKLLISHIARL